MEEDVRVLVVDDEAAVRRLMVRALSRRGYTTAEAADGATALGLVAVESFDVVLLDYGLPDMTGAEVLERLRSTRATATTPVLLVTGRGSVPHRVEGLAAGADDYLVKPVDLDELVARVGAQVRGREAWRTEVADALSERAALAAALASVDATDVGGAAGAVADLLVQIPEVARVAVVDLTPAVPVRLADTAASGRVDGVAVSPTMAAELRQAIGARSRALAPEVRDGVLPGSEGVVTALGVEHDADLVAALIVEAAPAAGVNRRDPQTAVADLLPVVDRVLGRTVVAARVRGGDELGIRAVIRDRSFHPVFQPIVDLRTHAVVGYEALTRFDDGSPPDLRFVHASGLGLGIELEVVTLEGAVAAARSLPDDRYVSYNVSGALLLDGGLKAILDDRGPAPVVLEITEHERIDDYASVRAAMAGLGERVRLSVDDAGSGWSSLRHVLSLRPDFVKLDRGWVHAIDHDPARQALLLGIGRFVDQMGGKVIAEGIETEAELTTLRELGIPCGQGFLLGRPRAVGELEEG